MAYDPDFEKKKKKTEDYAETAKIDGANAKLDESQERRRLAFVEKCVLSQQLLSTSRVKER